MDAREKDENTKGRKKGGIGRGEERRRLKETEE